MKNTLLIRKLWQLFSDRKWDEAQTLLHPHFVATWPQSKERMTSPENFINVNRHYPGNHKIEIVHIHEIGQTVISTVWIVGDTGQKTFATSYFQIEGEKVSSTEEYWAEPYEAPLGREKWVERY